MRIARIIEYFVPEPGGMERHALELSKQQRNLGHEVDLYFSYGQNSLAGGIQTYQFKTSILSYKNKLGRILFNLWVKEQVIKHHRKNPYSLIHFHGDFLEGWIGGTLARKVKIPVVLTIHAGLNKRLARRQFKFCFSKLSHIICVSQEIKNDLALMGISPDKVSVISSGVSLQEFNEVSQEAIGIIRDSYSKPILISVGVLRINKGYEYLVEAYRELKQEYNSATLLVIGDGPERKNLEERASGIANIHFLGRQDHGKVVEYLKAADIFVLASISTSFDREGTPTSIMEAMAAGLSIVATRVGGIPNLIRDASNGLVVDPADSDQLARALISLIGDEALRSRMARQNLEDIRKKDWSIIVQQIEMVYQSMR